jgi:UDP-N-acetylglucosamine diphosphorylase / glucose-1-phosphate thymidylyltransferase / UDP-N-acetylgalactosamine diphosphorylase / glucosamine-1-phosphate N-acetyltransferase / galactosamine-1-phosphate N-acetyltransferase
MPRLNRELRKACGSRRPDVCSGQLIPQLKASEFFALPASLARFASFFSPEAAPWEWLKKIAAALETMPLAAGALKIPPGVHIEGRVWLDATVKLPVQAVIQGPAFIGARSEIRAGAFIRGQVIAGEGCVLGHASEFKNCLLMDGALAPHFNYVGDSILGNGAHLGAGAICSNMRLDQAEVKVKLPSGTVSSGLRKFGAVLGDRAEVGCNAVLNPGTLLGPRALVSPCTSFNGYLPPATMARSRPTITTAARRD